MGDYKYVVFYAMVGLMWGLVAGTFMLALRDVIMVLR